MQAAQVPASSPVVYLYQQQPIGPSGPERALAVRSLLGACLLGTLEHYGRRDHRAHKTASRNDVRLVDLHDVVRRGDHGLHGCAFEYAVHEAINGAPGIPEPVRSAVASVVSAEVGVLYTELGVPFTTWAPGVRSVMFAAEKHWGDPERLAVRSELGVGALIWAGEQPEPYLLGRVLPMATIGRVTSPHGIARSMMRELRPNLPAALSDLWRTDLFLGGATVEATPAVAALVGRDEPTAWISASVKYPARMVVGGPGLHLGLESGYLPRRLRPLDTLRSTRRGLRVLTLPLDGDFMTAFNRAWRIVNQVLTFYTPVRAHPARFESRDRALVEELGARRTQYVVDIAHDLLHTGQPGVVSQVLRPGLPDSGGYPPLVVPVPQVSHAA